MKESKANYNREELTAAIATFNMAKEAWYRADEYYRDAATKTRKLLASIDRDLSYKEQVSQRKALEAAINDAGAEETNAQASARIAAAVYRVAGQNVAKAAANLLLKALLGNEKMQKTPPHYKKFAAFVAEVFGPFDPDVYINVNYGLNVVYRQAEYNYNQETVCPMENGALKLPEVPTYEYVATYDEITGEVNQAAAYFMDLEATLKGLREQADEEKKKYKTDAKYLLPYVEYNAMHVNFNFNR